jgi:hypothetical protein
MKTLLGLLVALLTFSCGGDVDGDGAGGSAGLGGSAGGGGSGGIDAGTGGGAGASGGAAGAPDGGWTACSTPDWVTCGVPECPVRPGCTLCQPAKPPGLYGLCAETLDINHISYKPGDGAILYTPDPQVTPKSHLWEAPFSAGVFLAAHGQEARVAYADRGLWTGEPLPMPTTCPQPPGARHCGGYCGGCPAGEICTGRSPLHPYGACIPTSPNICSRNPDVKDGGACSPGDRCFIFTVEPARQPLADAKGFCVPKALCEAYAAHLPGGVQCK